MKQYVSFNLFKADFMPVRMEKPEYALALGTLVIVC